MRILIIHTIYKTKGGEDTVVFNEIELLRSAGHQIGTIFFFNNIDTIAKIIQLPFNWSSYKTTLRKIDDFKPDIIHVHNLHFAGSPAVLYAAKKRKIPVVMTLHNYRLFCPSATLFFNDKLFTRSLGQYFPFSAVQKGVYQNSMLITFWVALSCAVHHLAGTWDIPNKYIVPGEYAKDLFMQSKMKDITSKMVVKPNFCYGGALQTKPGNDYYIYVGRLSSEKGIDILLNAFTHTGLNLKIVGYGPMEEQVKATTVQQPNIKFLGSKKQGEVRELIAGAKALIFPSVWFETFGMVIVEAFSVGVPVIASSIGEPQHLVAKSVNGLLFEPGDEEDLMAKLHIFEAMDDETKGKLRANALKTYQENYSPQTNLNAMSKIYEAVLAGNGEQVAYPDLVASNGH